MAVVLGMAVHMASTVKQRAVNVSLLFPSLLSLSYTVQGAQGMILLTIKIFLISISEIKISPIGKPTWPICQVILDSVKLATQTIIIVKTGRSTLNDHLAVN